MSSFLSSLFVKILPLLLVNVTPDLRGVLVSFLDKLEQTAKQTKSPFDDILVSVLRAVLQA